MIRLSVPYRDFLKTQRPEVHTVFHLNEIGPSISSTDGGLTRVSIAEPAFPMTIPPNRSMIDFSFLPRFSIHPPSKKSKFLKSGGGEPLEKKVVIPPSFNWYDTVKASSMCPVLNQFTCGSCWAFSTTTSMSDQFVIQDLLHENPQLDITELIACWQNDINEKCEGSNPALALLFIQKQGIQSSASIQQSYSWCSSNDVCNGTSSSFNDTSSKDLNALVPACSSIARSPSPFPFPKFYVKNIRASPLMMGHRPFTLEEAQMSIDRVKEFIMQYGPVIGNYNIFENFYSGNYLCSGDNPDNIYLDCVNYTSGNRESSMDFTSFVGGHSVSIVGWGVGRAKGYLLGKSPSGEMFDVPYWIARNSWSARWGMDGFFRMAMFPINTFSQFDVTVEVQYSLYDRDTNQINSIHLPTGGTLLFEVSLTLPKTDEEEEEIKGLEEGYQEEKGQPDNDDSNNNMFVILLFVSLLLLFFVLMVLIILLFAGKHCKQGEIVSPTLPSQPGSVKHRPHRGPSPPLIAATTTTTRYRNRNSPMDSTNSRKGPVQRSQNEP